MDDGNWHVTVYCPASLDSPLLDKDSNEFDTWNPATSRTPLPIHSTWITHPEQTVSSSALTPSDDSDGLTIQPHA